MKNTLKLFCYDIQHLFGNVITTIIVLGLVFLPSIFTWYNVIACWDVFNNTGQLEVAVANCDAGYKDQLLPTKINVGNSVEQALRANSQIHWVFTTEDDAVDGASSGKYYAAIVIPENFSADMLSFYSSNTNPAEIIYYENEKKNAIAPRVTDQASTQVSTQINTTFAETLSDVVLGVLDNLSTATNGANAAQYAENLSNILTRTANELTNAKEVLNAYSSLTSAAQSLVNSSNTLLGQAKASLDSTKASTSSSEGDMQSAQVALESTNGALSSAIEQSVSAYASLAQPVNNAFSTADNLSANNSATLRTQAAFVQDNINSYQNIKTSLESLRDALPEQHTKALNTSINHVSKTIEKLQSLQVALNSSADKIDGETGAFKEKIGNIQSKISSAKESIAQLKTDYETNLAPSIDGLVTSVKTAVDKIDSRSQNIDAATANLQSGANAASGKLGSAASNISGTAQKIEQAANTLNSLASSINNAVNNADINEIKSIITNNPQVLAQALATPVATQRVAVFAANDFGSAMAPLYTSLALWVGALLALVLLSAQVSKRAQTKLKNPKSHQLFFGRFGVMAVVLLMQSTVLGLGNILFLGIQVENPMLYMLACWVGSLVFGFIIYTLVSLFANLGKAIAVLILILQITAGGGSFPLQLLPSAFEFINPFMPATHVINAMRAAQFGVYNNDFWVSIALELCFVLPFIVLGILRPVLVKATDLFVEFVERSKLIT